MCNIKWMSFNWQACICCVCVCVCVSLLFFIFRMLVYSCELIVYFAFDLAAFCCRSVAFFWLIWCRANSSVCLCNLFIRKVVIFVAARQCEILRTKLSNSFIFRSIKTFIFHCCPLRGGNIFYTIVYTYSVHYMRSSNAIHSTFRFRQMKVEKILADTFISGKVKVIPRNNAHLYCDWIITQAVNFRCFISFWLISLERYRHQ